MLRLTVDEIIEKINQKECFEAIAFDQSFTIKIDEYVPHICAAIHDGNQLRDELKKKSALSDYERWYEEDPHTKDFVSSLPIIIAGCDSRYEYDLNRGLENCIFEEAWGKKVWETPLSEKQKAKSLEKHTNFYRVVDALVQNIEKKFGVCLAYDIHSYNYKRREEGTSPVFNIGAENIDGKRFGKEVEYWKKELQNIQLPNTETSVEINGPFYGRGYFLKHITKKFKNTLVLATEVKKIYCDEEKQEDFPLVISKIKDQLKTAILNNTVNFLAKHSSKKRKNTGSNLLSSSLDPDIVKLDQKLYNIVKKIEVLNYVNPINIKKEKQRFFKSKFTTNPKFRYRQLNLNPFEVKRKLYALPIEKIKDIGVQKLYRDVIDSYTDKVDMLGSIGKPSFLYNSLRYFGAPNKRVQANANFLMSCPDQEEEPENIDAYGSKAIIDQEVANYGFDCKVEIAKNITAKAMVLNYQKKVVIREDAYFSPKGAGALAHHEVGVHMVTTINATQQPLHIFKLGMPINTKTQEGLAVMSEYLSDNLYMSRLKQLAARTIGIDMMLNGEDFKTVFAYMMDEYTNDSNEAFTLVSRIFRGGGFTKDFLYLDGFRELIEYMNTGKKIDNLLIGKTSLKYLPIIDEMVDRGIIEAPKYITHPFKNPVQTDAILKFIIDGIKVKEVETVEV